MACASFSSSHGDMNQQSLPGQLQVTAYVTHGMLTAHVIQGRYLTDPSGTPARDTYVKLSLIPDPAMRTFCDTEVTYDSSSPSYNEKFSFELLPEDRSRRLLLSVWSLDPNCNKSHLIGCMSFGVRRLLDSKLITGWYYLLPADLGRYKHLQVQQDEEEDQVVWSDRHKVSLRRGSEGYGMSLTGGCPTRVSRIVEGSPAHIAGLQVGDVIDKINGHQVGSFTQDGVVRVIRHSGNAVVIEVLRPASLTRMEGSPRRPNKRHFRCNFKLLPGNQAEPESKRVRKTSEESMDSDDAVMVVDSALERATPKSIIKRRGSLRRSRRVSFSETVTCQPIMKVADIMELFRDEE